MKNAITAVPGLKVGHAQDLRAGTGCTVILCEGGAAAGVDVRGGAPGTRETDCLNPMNLVPQVHAVYLGGGSAFGLDGACGVMKYLEERKIGFEVGVTRVPIVPGAVLFDLTVGDPFVRPDGPMGYRACLSASAEDAQRGNVGAGTGATVGKAAGAAYMMKGGLGTASFQTQELIIGALMAVNCFGDVVDPSTGEILAGALNETGDGFRSCLELLASGRGSRDAFAGNTTIGAVATNARLSKAQATRVAIMAHDGLARAINPVHTLNDGDTIFCLATGEVEADVTAVGALAARVVAQAVVDAVTQAESLYGFPCCREVRRRREESGNG